MSDLMERLKKASKLDYTSTLDHSKVLGENDTIETLVPAVNIALGGSIHGGFSSGLTLFIGESRTFKSLISLLCAKAYLDKYEDGVVLFYDSEMGASSAYFDSLGIDRSRVLHVPITNIEELQFDLMGQLNEIKRGEHIIVIVDSIGNLASKKEVEDALNEKSVADMTRAKQLKALTRMITPLLSLKNIPMIGIAHTYKTMDFIPQTVMSGGSGLLYSASTVINITRSQEKQGTDLIGYNFNLSVMKGRSSRERSKIPLTVTFDNGILRYSGLLEMALSAGFVVKPSNGWYQKVDPETGEILSEKMRAKDTNSETFWESILGDRRFDEWVKRNFKVAYSKLLDTSGTAEPPNPEFTV